MNGWLLASGILASLLALGHATGGHTFVFRPMAQASFEAIAQRTMVFVWHFSTLALFMMGIGLVYAAFTESSRDLAVYLLIQSAGLSAIHLGTAATSGVDGWTYKMPQWAAFGVIAALAAAGLSA